MNELIDALVSISKLDGETRGGDDATKWSAALGEAGRIARDALHELEKSNQSEKPAATPLNSAVAFIKRLTAGSSRWGQEALNWLVENGYVKEGLVDRPSGCACTYPHEGICSVVPTEDEVRFEVRMERKTYENLRREMRVRGLASEYTTLTDAFVYRFTKSVDEGLGTYFFKQKREIS